MKYAKLAELLVSGPLYQEHAIDDAEPQPTPNPRVYTLVLPPTIRRCCQCSDSPTIWQLDDPDPGRVATGFRVLVYSCKNCEKWLFCVWAFFEVQKATGAVKVVKCGQWPKLEIVIPKDFEAALGKHKSLYLKAMTLRHNNYGIGAVSYLRRVIEDTTDEMLTFLAEQMVATESSPAAIEELRRANAGTRFEDKVEIAARVMPAHLRPGGVNPFGDLYQLVSIGLHDKSDEECCEIVDGMDAALKVIYTQLKLHAEEMKKYTAATKTTSQLIEKLKKRKI